MRRFQTKTIGFIIATSVFIYACNVSHVRQDRNPEYRNFYGIAWNGTPHENLAYARQMGYDYVFYQRGMENDSLSDGLYFYLETPEYSVYERQLDTKKPHSPEEVEFAETHYALMNTTSPFPDNIARGWFFNDHLFSPQLDFQQQKVITWAIDTILKYVAAIEARNPDFRFGGFAWDVPQPPGDFWDTIQSPGRQITLAHWTGGDYGARHPEVIHNYSTYSDGKIEYYKQLFKATRAVYPGARFMMEPYRIYEDWIEDVKERPDADEVTPDLLAQEKYGTEFVDDNRIFESGLIEKDHVISTTPDRFGDRDNRTFAARAAVNGAWFSWYGRFGGTGDMPPFKSIREVPARLKLIRVLANWENLNNTPLNERSWDGAFYKSPTAQAGPDAIAVLQPYTNKMFIVFNTEKGIIQIPDKMTPTAVYAADDLFMEMHEAEDAVVISNSSVKPATPGNINKGYIVYLK